MKITQPRLSNTLHESTNIQIMLEKNDEDLTGYSFKSLRIEGVKKSNLSVQSCVFGSYRNPEGLKYNHLLKYLLHLPISPLIVFKYLL